MAGTRLGGRKAAATNKQRYGQNFYGLIGRKGGKISRGGGFAQNPELASVAGRKGGKTSRRGSSKVIDSGGSSKTVDSKDYLESYRTIS
jgi:general stress protein YciG